MKKRQYNIFNRIRRMFEKKDEFRIIAEAKYNEEDYESAIEYFSKSIEKDPDNYVSYHDRGVCKGLLDQHESALMDFSTAIMLNPIKYTAYFYRGNCKASLNDHIGALEDYNKAIQLNPNSAEYYGALGYYKSTLYDLQGAIQDYSKAIQLDPTNFLLFSNRGICRIELLEYEGAIKDFSTAIQLDPNNPSNNYYNRGSCKDFLKDYKGAIEDYSIAIKLEPNSHLYYNARGFSNIRLEYDEAAIEDLSKSLELNKFDAHSYYVRAILKLRANRKYAIATILSDLDSAIHLGHDEAQVVMDQLLNNQVINVNL